MSFIPRLQGWATTQKSISVIHSINSKIEQSHVMILIDARKSFVKVHPFMKKISQYRNREEFFSVYWRDVQQNKIITANIIICGEKLNASPQDQGLDRVSALTISTQFGTRGPSQCNKVSKTIKVGKEELSLLLGNTTVYVENTEESKKKKKPIKII